MPCVRFVLLFSFALTLFGLSPAFGQSELPRFELGLPLYPSQSPPPARIPPTDTPRDVPARVPPDPAPAPLSFTPMTGREKFSYYVHATFGPVAVGRTVLSSGLAQARNSNPEWGQGMEGYGKRFASKFGQKVIKRSIQHGLGALLREDPRYFHSEKPGLWPRMSWAVTRTFLIRKDSGGYKIADARLIGTFSAAIISRQWHPEPDRTLTNGLRAGATSVGYDVLKNLLKEFWPDIRRRVFR